MTITLLLEDGTGVEGANAYDAVADAITWLVDRDYHALEGEVENDATKGPLRLTEATKVIEREVDPYVDGYPLNEDQGLLYPRAYATDNRGRELDSDERPSGLREGIFLIAEAMAEAAKRNQRITLVDDDAHIHSHHGSSGSTFRRSRTFADLYPEAWWRVRESLPSAGLRLIRA